MRNRLSWYYIYLDQKKIMYNCIWTLRHLWHPTCHVAPTMCLVAPVYIYIAMGAGKRAKWLIQLGLSCGTHVYNIYRWVPENMLWLINLFFQHLNSKSIFVKRQDYVAVQHISTTDRNTNYCSATCQFSLIIILIWCTWILYSSEIIL